MDLRKVATVRIHPAIGIARVGNSPEYFIGPEVSDVATRPAGGYKDKTGRIKRQAARFRLYGYDSSGKVIGEVTPGNGVTITWTVHVANKKSAWYDFNFPLDLFDQNSANYLSQLAQRRNPQFTGPNRAQLIIDAGPQSIRATNKRRIQLDGGSFCGKPVMLGEIATDGKGRLVFIAGFGEASTIYEGSMPDSYANNPGWHDDIADGPVEAKIKIGNRTIEADGAWIVTAPPNYAPHVVAAQTLYDVILDSYSNNVWYAPPATTSFEHDVLPIFRRLNHYQWVNRGFFERYGWQSRYDFDSSKLLDRMAVLPAKGADDPNAQLRRDIYYMFRQKGKSPKEEPPFLWPPVYGSGSDGFTGAIVSYFVYTDTILQHLSNWQAGKFMPDYSPNATPPPALAAVPLAEQPATLDRAALDWCIGGPFHPGCELTWIVRHPSLYRTPLRIRRATMLAASDDYGPSITPAIALADDGPLSVSGPGDLTKWMAVPWQADTASCRAGYNSDVDPYLPTFWPARVPNHVIAESAYRTIVNPRSTPAARRDAFRNRSDFFREIQGPEYWYQLQLMLERWANLGIVEGLPNPRNDREFPATLYVETGYQSTVKAAAPNAGSDAGVSLAARFGRKGLRSF